MLTFLRTVLQLSERYSELPSRVLKLWEDPMSPAALPDWIVSSTRHIPIVPVQLVAAGLSA